MNWKVLAERLRTCEACPRLVESRTNVVMYDGAPVPDVLFIGEAPGRQEDESGVPFVGRAGSVLREHIDEFLTPASISWGITNLVKCRPVERPNRNGKPTAAEIEMCKSRWLTKEIELLDPHLIVLLGDYALRGVLGHSGISQWRGRLLRSEGGKPLYFATWHPAALVYDKKKQETFREDFARIKEIALNRVSV